MTEGKRAHWVAPHRDGSPKYLWEPVCESEQHKSLSGWKRLLRYFCNSMLYKTPAPSCRQGMERWWRMWDKTGSAGCFAMLFMVTWTVTLQMRVSIYVKSCFWRFPLYDLFFLYSPAQCTAVSKLSMYLFQNNPIRGETEAEEESVFWVLLYGFIKSGRELTSAAQNQAGLWNLCVNEPHPICELWSWFIFLQRRMALNPPTPRSCPDKMPGGLRASRWPCRHLLPATHVVGLTDGRGKSQEVAFTVPLETLLEERRSGNSWQNL